ncbi:MAG TPA: winged helix-turn-helix domain-containing protein [Vicinamibacteria bacterium]|nr:winged helix-turn-helix domain-containing protein [Vicinamibacteria bacterium]
MTSDPGPRPSNGAEVRALRFGVFEMSLRACELRRAGRLVRIQPQPFRVLALLAGRPGEVVTREEIQAEVWPAGTFVDFEQSLNFCIRQIRSALGDSALSPRYIETLPRRGYRWVGGPVERVTAIAELREWPRPVAERPAVEPPPAPGAGSSEVDTGLPQPPVSRGEQRVMLGLAGLALAAVVVALCLALRPVAAPRPPSFQRITFRRGLVSSARFLPHGEVVYAASWDGRPLRLYVAGADGRETRALDVEAGMIVGAAASGEVAYLHDGVLSRAPVAGGPPKAVLKEVSAADWAPDEAQFAVVRREAGRYRLEFPVGRAVAEVARTSAVRLSPDARYLALAVHPLLDDDRGTVVVFDREGRRVAASEGWASLEGLAWPPGGGEVWFTAARTGADSELHALGLDGRVRLLLAGMGRLVLHDVGPDGRVLLESAALRSEMLFRREGESEASDLSWLDFSAGVSLTPDGGLVLFYESGQGGGADYMSFVRRTDGSLPVRVGTGRALSLSPDGQWALAVRLRRPDRLDVLPIGPGEPRTIRIPGALTHEAAGFLPSGARIWVTTRDAGGQRASWLVDADGSHPRRLALPAGQVVLRNSFSPDGTSVAMSCPGGSGWCVVPLDGGAPRALRGARPDWYPTGWDEKGRVWFRERSNHVAERLWRVGAATGRVEAVADLAPRDRAGVEGVAGVVVARDGRAWAYNVLRRLSDLYVATGLP